MSPQSPQLFFEMHVPHADPVVNMSFMFRSIPSITIVSACARFVLGESSGNVRHSLKQVGGPSMSIDLADVRFYYRVEMFDRSFLASSWPCSKDVEGRW
jgi:hypothetical protein